MKCPLCGEEMKKGRFKGLDVTGANSGGFFKLDVPDGTEVEPKSRLKKKVEYLVGTMESAWCCSNCHKVFTVAPLVR